MGAETLSEFTHRRLNALGIRPRKGLGQNFLIDQKIIDRIIEAADLKESETVVEVGPGIGALTRSLVQTGASVKAFEIDEILADSLADALGCPENLEIIKKNILECDIARYLADTPYKVVANLPYYITSPIIRLFLENIKKPIEMVIMVQHEVAQTIMAKPGDMSLLALGVQMYGTVSLVSKVSHGCFYPAPKVDSAVIKIVPYEKELIPFEDSAKFFVLARAGFSMARKQILNPLSHSLDIPKEEIRPILEAAKIDPTRRAETLSIDEWLELFSHFKGVLK
ncbi:MAG: ribosomal RNA small subunit methyltransferase A [Dehalococcoidales bacterium]|nr:ribosomal RNA small subunit methyltransferase A [Dehalococcoidales bacterium]